jgi:hypothetical protein
MLRDFAVVVRGIATGANDFFFLTSEQVDQLELPEKFLVRAVGRTRDIQGEELTADTLRDLDAKGRPTFLFSPDGRDCEGFPATVQRYLRSGEAQGLATRPLLSTRQPWYKMEHRTRPPFLFAYLGRRNARFIRNFAQVVPLTGFLCVYPIVDRTEFVEALWRALCDPETVAGLAQVAKSYGSGALKVEPRALERLPFPRGVIERAGLELPPEPNQLALSLATNGTVVP